MRFHFVWICCMGMLMPLPLHGQASDPKQEVVRGRCAWVVATTIPQGLTNPLPMLSGDELQMVPLHLRAVGNPIAVDDTGQVRAVKVITKPDGAVAYEDLARCVIPEGVREALIVLVPKAGQEEGLMFNSKVIDLSKFKKGGCLYINLVKSNIGITIGEQKVVVKPGEMEFINPLNNEKRAVQVIRFFYEVPKEPKAEWKLMTSSKMAIYDSRREICVFFYNPEIENVDFRGIPLMTPLPPTRTQDQ